MPINFAHNQHKQATVKHGLIFDAANNGANKSHPLALTQLLVGYHAVKAAMGVRAY